MTRGLFRMTPVLAVLHLDDDDLQRGLDESRARLDDAYWAAFVRRPFTWQRFLTWWVARRWIRPRDVTRE